MNVSRQLIKLVVSGWLFTGVLVPRVMRAKQIGDLIAEVKHRAKLPIIGNGDIRSAVQAKQRLQETGVDAVMIGRGALRNPWIFKECADGTCLLSVSALNFSTAI